MESRPPNKGDKVAQDKNLSSSDDEDNTTMDTRQ